MRKNAKKATKRTCSMALAAVLAFAPVTVFGATDTANHWANAVISDWESKGLIKGYEDGTFKPDNSVSRAEFVTMMNNVLKNDAEGTVSFTDVKETDWFYQAVAAAVNVGYCNGYEDGTFKPSATISRAEAAVMIANAMGLEQDAAGAEGFSDEIPVWAVGSVGAVVKAGYMSGYPDGTFGAAKSITRAEAVSSLNRILTQNDETVAATEVVLTEKEAVLEDQVVAGNVVIDSTVEKATLRDVEIQGDLVIRCAEDDKVVLDNVTVKGRIIIEKTGVEVSFSGKTDVKEVQVGAVCELTADDFEGSIDTVRITKEVAEKGDVVIDVPVDEVIVEKKASVKVKENVDTIQIAEDAEGSELDIAKDVVVDLVKADGKVEISGDGTVKKLEANADGITYHRDVTINKTEVASGVEVPTVVDDYVTGEYDAPNVNGTSAFALAHPVSLLGAGEDETIINGHIFINFNGNGQDYPDGTKYPVTFSDFTLQDDNADAQVAINTGGVNYVREHYTFTIENVTMKDYLFGVQLASGYQNNQMTLNNVNFENIWCAASVQETNELAMNDCTFTNVTYQLQKFYPNYYYPTFGDETTKVDGTTVSVPGMDDWENTEASYTDADGNKVTGTFEDAVAKAQAGSTVTLVKDVTLDSDLTSFADNLTIEGAGKTVTTTANYGINVPTNVTSLTINNLNLEKAEKTGTAIKVPSANADFTLNLTKCNFDGFEFGIYRDLPKNTTAKATMNLTGCTFENADQKAIYVEALTNSTIQGCQFINCGTKEDGAHSMSSAVDINLKYGDYENISIQDCNFEGNGAGLGGALLIKARDDGSYADTPATLTGVTITGCTFTDNNRDIVFGEPMKNNVGPYAVSIDGESVSPSEKEETVLPIKETYSGAEVWDYRVAAGNAGISFAGSATGVVVNDADDFDLTFDENTFGEAVTDFFCADCVANPGTNHADHETFATVNADGSLEMVQADDGRMPYFQMDNVDLESNTYTISYDLNVAYDDEADGVLSVNTGNTGWGADAHFVLKQGEGLYNFSGNTLLSDADVFKKDGTFSVVVTYTLDNGTPKTELTLQHLMIQKQPSKAKVAAIKMLSTGADILMKMYLQV